MKRQVKHRLEDILDNAVAKGELAGLSMMVLKEGKELFYHQAGYASVEHRVPIYRDTLYRFYSMTKPVTATAAMILLERGDLDLRESVENILPGFKNQKVWQDGQCVAPIRPVLIKDLLNMTSGLTYPGGNNETQRQTAKLFEELDQRLYGPNPMTTQELANRLGECPLAFQPGTHWMYGTSADVLGAVIESVSGMTLGEFFKKEIFDPLEMKSTGFSPDPKDLHRLATAYDISQGKIVPFTQSHLGIINAMDRKPAFESGGAGLVSSIDDFKNFTQMLLNKGSWNGKQLLNPKTVRFLVSEGLTEDQKTYYHDWIDLSGFSYGNLMRIFTKPGLAMTMGTVGEYGWNGWLGCYFSNSPKDKLTILFMEQRKDAGVAPALRRCINVIYSNLV